MIQVEQGKPGVEVSKGKKRSQKNNLLIECAQGDQLVRCPNRGVCVHQSSSGGGIFVVFCGAWLCFHGVSVVM